ncbi:MAG: hypothetical protein KGO53_08480 [Alphaproteobacteria bacterium]|nr:hypothetical protein [Alphaproteobacteria bacterium]
MNVHQVAYLFAIAAGIVSSGAVGSLWALATDESPSLAALEEPDLLTPVRALAYVLSAPTTLLIHAAWYLIDRPLWGLFLLLAGLGWSFVQGVTIMTQIFGVT